MYNFGVVVDDAFMGISHVLRAQAGPLMSNHFGPSSEKVLVASCS